jgi:hypothetical protein
MWMSNRFFKSRGICWPRNTPVFTAKTRKEATGRILGDGG